jgi:hypothetical protein
MKRLKYLFILHIVLFNSCSNSLDYKTERKFKSIINNENCQLEFYFPVIKVKDSNLNLSELNDLLEKYADHEYYGQSCDETKTKKRIIKGDYKITLQTEDILSIEFTTNISQSGEQSIRTVYHSLVMNPKKLKEKEYSLIQPGPEALFSNFDRGVLKKYVEDFNKTNNSTVNLLAYDTGSKYAITWGLTNDKFLLYVGGEGEWFGYDKIEIPIEEIKNNR